MAATVLNIRREHESRDSESATPDLSLTEWIARELKNAPPLSDSRARRISQLLHLGGGDRA